MKTFPIGGVHPSDNKKWSCEKSIEVLELPDIVNIPLAQHIGAPATAKVAKGDKVLTGQLIAEATGFMSANIHSPISGTVTAVDMQPNGQGLRQMMITIKREGDEWMPEIDLSKEVKRECDLDSAAIIAKIKDAGIVGMGGATFPTHVKLSIPNGCKAEYLIINGVECEPYLTSDHRTMLERGEELLVGVEILKKALGVEKAIIGVENNKPDAIVSLTKIIKEKKFAIEMTIPNGYLLRSESDDFLWISNEYPAASQGFFLYAHPFEGKQSLTTEALVKARNEFARRIPGPTDGSYMTTVTKLPNIENDGYTPFLPERNVLKVNGVDWIGGKFRGNGGIFHQNCDFHMASF